MKRIALLTAAASLGLVLGCGGGQITGGAGAWTLGSETPVEGGSRVWYVIQYADVERGGTLDVLFAVVWRGGPGATAEGNSEGMISTINGQDVRPNFTRSAIYALEPEYSLNEITMSEEERERLLDRITGPDGPFTDDPLWLEAVEPALRYVPSPGEETS